MRYPDCSTRHLFVTLLAAPVLAPLLALADDAASFDHSGDPPPLPLQPQRASAADLTFERQFDQDFFRDYWAINPERAIAEGQFEFADRTRVLDARTRAQSIGKLNAWLSQLHRFNPETLSDGNRGDWWLLNDTFEAERWALTEYRAWEWNPAQYDVGAPIAAILRADYAPIEQRLRAVLKRLNDVSTYYTTARQNLVRPARDLMARAIECNQRGLDLLGPGLAERIMASQLRDSEKALFTRRIAAARIAIEGYIAWLQGMETQTDLDRAQIAQAADHPVPQSISLDTALDGRLAPPPSFTTVTTEMQPEHSSLVRTFFSNDAMTSRWSSRQAGVRTESAGNIDPRRQPALVPTVQ